MQDDLLKFCKSEYFEEKCTFFGFQPAYSKNFSVPHYSLSCGPQSQFERECSGVKQHDRGRRMINILDSSLGLYYNLLTQ